MLELFRLYSWQVRKVELLINNHFEVLYLSKQSGFGRRLFMSLGGNLFALGELKGEPPPKPNCHPAKDLAIITND